LEEGVKRQIVCIRIGMCSVCTCNVHVHTHQGMYKNLGGRSQTADCCRRSRTPPVRKIFCYVKYFLNSSSKQTYLSSRLLSEK